jgi:hypothetical protein
MEKDNLKIIFRNKYFCLAVVGAFLLIYAGFIIVALFNYADSVSLSESSKRNDNSDSEQIKKKNASVISKDLENMQIVLVDRGGWIDFDNRKITIVLRVKNLEKDYISEIIRSSSVKVQIDGDTAAIVNLEPFHETSFLIRAESILNPENFGKFRSGIVQSVEIKTKVTFGEDSKTEEINRRFVKTNKVQVEGVKIHWK